MKIVKDVIQMLIKKPKHKKKKFKPTYQDGVNHGIKLALIATACALYDDYDMPSITVKNITTNIKARLDTGIDNEKIIKDLIAYIKDTIKVSDLI